MKIDDLTAALEDAGDEESLLPSEELEGEASPDVQPGTVENEWDIEEAAEGAAEVIGEVEHAQSQIDEMEDTAAALESWADFIDQGAAMGGLDKSSAYAARLGVSQLVDGTGLETIGYGIDDMMPALETFGLESSNITKSFGGRVKDLIKKIWEGILNIYNVIVDKVAEMMKRLSAWSPLVKRKLASLKKEVSALKSDAGAGVTVNIPSVLKLKTMMVIPPKGGSVYADLINAIEKTFGKKNQGYFPVEASGILKSGFEGLIKWSNLSEKTASDLKALTANAEATPDDFMAAAEKFIDEAGEQDYGGITLNFNGPLGDTIFVLPLPGGIIIRAKGRVEKDASKKVITDYKANLIKIEVLRNDTNSLSNDKKVAGDEQALSRDGMKAIIENCESVIGATDKIVKARMAMVKTYRDAARAARNVNVSDDDTLAVKRARLASKIISDIGAAGGQVIDFGIREAINTNIKSFIKIVEINLKAISGEAVEEESEKDADQLALPA